MWKKIFLIVLVIFLAIVLIGALWQKDKIIMVRQYMDDMNIGYIDAIQEAPALWKAYKDSNNYTSEEIADQLASSKETVTQVLDNYEVDISRDFTLEEEKQLLTGQLKPEEALKAITRKNQTTETAKTMESDQPENQAQNQLENQSKSQSSESKQPEEQAPGQSKEQAIVNKYVSQLYACKAEYMGRLGQAIADKNAGTAMSLEGECDGKVSGILASLESELQAIGASTDIVNTIRNEYEKEKSLTKSYYIDQYRQYLP